MKKRKFRFRDIPHGFMKVFTLIKVKLRTLKKRDETVIPEGVYCYDTDENGKFRLCPYWKRVKSGEYAYCKYLGMNDNDMWWLYYSHGLLWDQCKECGINDDWEDEEDA